MKEYCFREEPFEIYGVPLFKESGMLERLPASVRERLPSLKDLGRRCPGARLRFRTNSKRISLCVKFEKLTPDVGMSLMSAQSANVFAGPMQSADYIGLIRPVNYYTAEAAGEVKKSARMEDITIFLPRNEVITDIIIGLEDDAYLEPPTPYRYSLPILYYGSSITEGGCCSKPANAYNAFISRWLDTDYYNFGFSGSARGELAMADYVNTIPKSILVMDYDHNSPSAEHLQQTHEPFFKRIREHDSKLPVVLLTRPNFDYGDAPIRREIIRKTYQNAVEKNDKNVYFIDGEMLFGTDNRDACTADTIHPNDLGMYRMAKCICPVIQKILAKQNQKIE